MQPVCRYGDVHCLTRWSAEDVINKALALLARTSGHSSDRVVYRTDSMFESLSKAT